MMYLVIFIPLSFAGEETPVQGMKAIIELYKTKNFDTLIRERYAEIHKAKSEDDISKLVTRFSERFSNEKKLKQVIQIYEMALQSKPVIKTNENPQITETDKIANFAIGEKSIKLYLLKSGKWGFHL